ncbi:MAG: single-stranded-DNA-specific exonuclease RecJ [Coxiellaceae bacterium]|nr:single-stranded-DNA-specific exonuclease RecJ [Coxiellaceae bacterium]
MNKRILRRSLEGENNSGLRDFNPLLQRVFAARNVSDLDEIDKTLQALLPYDELMQIDQAVVRLAIALEKQESVIVVGDFDADGATSTAVAVKAMQSFGLKAIDYLVPNRFEFGYGLTPEIVDVAEKSKPDLIITVDNGIASHAGVDRANELGIDVVVTDHHLPPAVLPNAVAIVNPNQEGDEFSSKNLAGVGVIFYVMLALRAYLKDNGWFESQAMDCPKMTPLLDYVALGTVADVVPLDKNNRILVHQGLRRIRAGCANIGIEALILAARRQSNKLKASDLAYGLAPRLNAAGRLEDMSFGIACLLEEDLSKATEMANRLNELNMERRALENQMEQEAYSILDALDMNDMGSLGICVYDPNWHQGVVGLVASRVKEKLHRPVIAFAKVSDDELKGSARSIKGIHIRDVLDVIATQHPGLVTKFGGHAMAAGLSLPLAHYEKFQKIFAETVAERVSPEILQNVIETDGELKSTEFTLANAQALREAGPWGQGFPEPLFDGVFRLIDQRIVGERHLKMVLQPSDSSIYVDAIAFNVDIDQWPNHQCDYVHLVYHLDVNYFRDQRRLQLLVEEIFVAEEVPA